MFTNKVAALVTVKIDLRNRTIAQSSFPVIDPSAEENKLQLISFYSRSV